jgi:hypothetical protein
MHTSSFVWFLIGLGPGGPSEAREGLSRRDAMGLVTVVVTLIPATRPGGSAGRLAAMRVPRLGTAPRVRVSGRSIRASYLRKAAISAMTCVWCPTHRWPPLG